MRIEHDLVQTTLAVWEERLDDIVRTMLGALRLVETPAKPDELPDGIRERLFTIESRARVIADLVHGFRRGRRPEALDRADAILETIVRKAGEY